MIATFSAKELEILEQASAAEQYRTEISKHFPILYLPFPIGTKSGDVQPWVTLCHRIAEFLPDSVCYMPYTSDAIPFIQALKSGRTQNLLVKNIDPDGSLSVQQRVEDVTKQAREKGQILQGYEALVRAYNTPFEGSQEVIYQRASQRHQEFLDKYIGVAYYKNTLAIGWENSYAFVPSSHMAFQPVAPNVMYDPVGEIISQVFFEVKQNSPVAGLMKWVIPHLMLDTNVGKFRVEGAQDLASTLRQALPVLYTMDSYLLPKSMNERNLGALNPIDLEPQSTQSVAERIQALKEIEKKVAFFATSSHDITADPEPFIALLTQLNQRGERAQEDWHVITQIPAESLLQIKKLLAERNLPTEWVESVGFAAYQEVFPEVDLVLATSGANTIRLVRSSGTPALVFSVKWGYELQNHGKRMDSQFDRISFVGDYPSLSKPKTQKKLGQKLDEVLELKTGVDSDDGTNHEITMIYLLFKAIADGLFTPEKS